MMMSGIPCAIPEDTEESAGEYSAGDAKRNLKF
jgi:hypothetical protein